MKQRLATVWLGGCSGSHMSLLDMDERLLDLSDRIELVYGPLTDIKEFPENVHITLVEGAVDNADNEMKIRRVHERTKILVALGDCPVTGNVPSMRNQFTNDDVLQRAYVEQATQDKGIPKENVPTLLTHVRPIHSVVKVDFFIQGCPPPADVIHFALTELLEGRRPELVTTRFGK